MKILLVTYSFPPAAGVGVLRAASLAKYLPENDVHVEVLTAHNAPAVGHDATSLQELFSELVIHRIWTPDLPFAIRKAIKRLVSRAPKSTGDRAAEPARPNAVKQLIANLLLPDPQVGWLPFADYAARRIIRERGIELVLITVPPFSTSLLAVRLRKHFPALPIVLDFRDEWLTSTLKLVSFNNNDRAQRIARMAESEAVHSASAVVCVTEASVSELRKRYPLLPAAHFQCIPNGYDTVTTKLSKSNRSAHRDSTDPILVTYIGSIYGSTDPASLVEAVVSLPTNIRTQLRFRFIGHIETLAYRELLLSLGAQVELIGFLPQAEALGYIEITDYVLLITHDPINVAAKLYDYLGSGRPILAAVHPNGEVQQILATTRAGWSSNSSSFVDIARMLTEAVMRGHNLAPHFHPDYEKIASFHRRPLAVRYASLLRSIVEARPC